MSESDNGRNEKRPMTPLWVVSLFVSLTEVIAGLAATQTNGAIQIAFTVFVIFFPFADR